MRLGSGELVQRGNEKYLRRRGCGVEWWDEEEEQSISCDVAALGNKTGWWKEME